MEKSPTIFKHLDRLRASGERKWDTLPNTADLPPMPEGFDIDKFNRGRQFFQHNLFSCTFGMVLSLVCGLSIVNLLDPLVFTGKSDTPVKSLRRYVRTFLHVLKWHFGNVWDPATQAYASIVQVRQKHNAVRRAMMGAAAAKAMCCSVHTSKIGTEMVSSEHSSKMGAEIFKESIRVDRSNCITSEDLSTAGSESSKVWVSQYDMSLVQCGFMGCVVMYPHCLGIGCTKDDLSDYCYFWSTIGYLLGISRDNNICSSDFTCTVSICQEIENDILIPALQNPPEKFQAMAEAFVDGMNLLFGFRLHSLQSFLALIYTFMHRPQPKLSMADKIRLLFLRVVFVCVKYVPLCRTALNKVVSLAFNTKSMT